MPNSRARFAWLLAAAFLASATTAHGAGFKLTRDAWGSSGGYSLSGEIQVGLTLGQFPVGQSEAESFVEDTGFWRGLHPWVLDSPQPGPLPPLQFSLERAIPNPFAGRTTLRYSIPGGAESPVQIRVFDVAGRQVRVLERGTTEPGIHTVVWDGRGDAGESLHAGVYFCLMEAGRFRASRRIVHLP